MLFFNQNRNHDLDKEAQWGSKDVNEITFDYLQVLFSSFNQKIYGWLLGDSSQISKKTW